MSVPIPRTRSAPWEALSHIRRAFGGRPPQDLMKFLKRHDGAEPADNIIRLGPGEDTRMREFIPAADMLRERQAIELFPQHGLPLGYDDVGDYFYISTLDAKVTSGITNGLISYFRSPILSGRFSTGWSQTWRRRGPKIAWLIPPRAPLADSCRSGERLCRQAGQ